MKNRSLSWDEVEKSIYNEKEWLKKSLEISPFSEKGMPISCPECIFRRIAILIVSGKIRAKEIKSPNLWGDLDSGLVRGMKKRHGGDWHNNMMKIIGRYFRNQNYEVEYEPRLNYGDADIGVYKKGEKDIYIEVGSVSLYKLLYNLETMRGVDFLLVPWNSYLVEFRIL